ncbi:hypothetical protein [Desertivirga brevis]|uniref:hypothetical protein n=1 Tax=Desertivirga brevis TaxID=2810310 RepID=UPI001A95E159|nr:hypothetical protein [Pedobacter sp. SYSU D00873]
MNVRRFCVAVFVLFFKLSFSQAPSKPAADNSQGLKINLNQDGSKFLRFVIWNQIWARSIQNNPGTMVGNEAAGRTFDIGARRIRTIAYAQLSPRYLILTHIGINNQTFINNGSSGNSGTGANGAGKKPQIFYHDVWNEYALIPAKNPETGKANKFTNFIGAGLHYWNGLSRQNSASTSNLLMLDAPGFNWPTLEISDQLTRQFGIYTKGILGKIHYQACVNKPFATSTTPVAGGPAVDNNGNSKASFGGYFDYQFLDQESNVLPFKVGTYLGAKKVLNVGAGFLNDKEATRSLTSDNELKKHDINIYCIDAFADLPIGGKASKMAITALTSFYKYNYGPNYIRASGTMNTGVANPDYSGIKAQEGAGNARYVLGTGNIWYTQAGVLLPQQISKKVRIQPMASYSLKNLEALDEAGSYYDIGSNFYIDGHNAKITVQYSDRPLYNNNKIFKRAGEWIMQFQIYL